jgi:thiosulfate dehydrogenase (quinone) large subunit
MFDFDEGSAMYIYYTTQAAKRVRGHITCSNHSAPLICYTHTMSNNSSAIVIPEPKVSRFLFSDTRMAWVWLLLRLYVGYQWVSAGWEKATSGLWIGPHAGTAISGFFSGAIAKASGTNPAVASWYAWFISTVAIPHAALFSYVITLGELAVGVGLILGAFTGIAAFFGAFMNLNYLFAGTVSINPLLLLIELFLILAWRNAGWLGLDRWLLPWLGVPWKSEFVREK